MASNKERALVTGATGYIGSKLVDRLLGEGWDVHVVTRRKSSTALIDRHLSSLVVHVHDGSIEGMLEIARNARPRVVFHLAAGGSYEHQPDDISKILGSNILFSTLVVESMLRADCRNLVNTGTFWQHYENRRYSPVNLYAASKQAFDALLQYYVEAKGLRVITLKPFDVYGPDDPRPKFLSSLRSALAEGSAIDISPGEQRIDLVHVDDLTQAYALAARRLVSGLVEGSEEYRVSGGERLTLRELVASIEKLLGRSVPVRWGGRPYRSREVMSPCDPGPPLPGWRPAMSLIRGLGELFSENHKTANALRDRH